MNNLAARFVSVPLTNLSLAYTNESFIAERVFPIMQVQKDTGQLWSYGSENLRIHNTVRAMGAKPNIIESTVSRSDLYNLEDHVLGEFIPVEITENEDAPLDAQMDVTENLTEALQVMKEKALADQMTVANILNNTVLAGAAQWTNPASDPFGDLKTAKTSVYTSCGKIANTLIVDYLTMECLKIHPDVVARFPGSPVITNGQVEAALGALFGFARVMVGMAQYDGSALGNATALTVIWAPKAIVAYIEESPRRKSRTFGITTQKNAPRVVQAQFYSGNGPAAQGQASLELLQRKSDYIQVSDKYDQVFIDQACAYLIDDTV